MKAQQTILNKCVSLLKAKLLPLTAIKPWKSQTAEFHLIGNDFEHGQKF